MKTTNLRSIFPRARRDHRHLPVFPYRPRSVRDYLHLAERIYRPMKAGIVYKKHQCWCIKVVEGKSSGYYGASFLELRIGENAACNHQPVIIIVHRGTNTPSFESGLGFLKALDESLKDLIADQALARAGIYYDLPSGKDNFLLLQIKEASKLTTQTLHFLGIKHAKVIHTGHSLGAALSQIVTHIHDHRSIGFETPGTAKLVSEIRFASKGFKRKPIDSSRYVSYNVSNSLVSFHLPAIGAKWECDFPSEDQHPSQWNLPANISGLHQIKQIEACYDKALDVPAPFF